MPAPTIGRIVHYTLTAADADAINKRRSDFTAFGQTLAGTPDPGHRGATGHVAHVGNHARAGAICAAMIVQTFDGHAANLQVHLDGTDTYWATSRTEGDGEGHWVSLPRT
ncbi:hypothetical protein V2S66_03205 [Streptomyces sp. V4-01]|uniref:Uncharacterized protein n=1 Tax=Actinacidiphila polyblastidii TaxID=3110430 RepID=A0ABU7P5A1_9ACTN|nr:hypothetical protein [Streptomyces sp. V4-01]